jgi:hypothetical protein
MVVGLVARLGDVVDAVVKELEHSRADQPPAVVVYDVRSGQPGVQELALAPTELIHP